MYWFDLIFEVIFKIKSKSDFYIIIIIWIFFLGGGGVKNFPWNTRYKWRVKNTSYCENVMFSLSFWVLLNAVKLQSMVIYLLLNKFKIQLKLALILITQFLGTFVFNNCLFPQTLIWTSFVTQVGVGVLYMGRSISKSTFCIHLYHFDRKGTSFVDLSLQKGACTHLQAYLRILHPFSVPLETS